MGGGEMILIYKENWVFIIGLFLLVVFRVSDLSDLGLVILFVGWGFDLFCWDVVSVKWEFVCIVFNIEFGL